MQLTGSDKQIAWATTIRDRAIPQIEDAVESLVKRPRLGSMDLAMDGVAMFAPEGEAALAEYRSAVTQIGEAMKSRTQASDWIREAASHPFNSIVSALNARCSTAMPAVYAELVAAGRAQEVR